MLERMGWKSGEGLGKDGGGITEPVNQLADTHIVNIMMAVSEQDRWLCVISEYNGFISVTFYGQQNPKLTSQLTLNGYD